MTRPVYEPSLVRKDAYLEFSSDQLFRRPAPSGAQGPISFRAATVSTLTVPTASEEEVHFTYWENEDSSVFGESLSAGLLNRVNFLQIGWYTITCVQNWAVNFNAVHGVLLLHADTTTANWPLGVGSPNEGAWHSGPTAEQFFYPPIISTTRKYPFFGITAGEVSGGIYGSVLVKTYQNSGINRDLDTCLLDIVFWGNSLFGLEPAGS